MYVSRVNVNLGGTQILAGTQWYGAICSRGLIQVRGCKPMQIVDVREGHKPVWTYAGMDISWGTTVYGFILLIYLFTCIFYLSSSVLFSKC